MKNQQSRISGLTVAMQLFTIFFIGTLSAQNSNFVFSWDKVGCQQTGESKVSLDSIISTSCLKVCKNSIVTYMISGDVEDISTIKWIVNGGEAMSTTEQDLSVPIKWDEISTGEITFEIVLKNDSIISKNICILKTETELILGWDKVGCQSDKDHVCEIKYDDNFSNLDCLLVCKGSKMNYKIFGGSESQVVEVLWEVTGGEVHDADKLLTSIDWGQVTTVQLEYV
jgi:hypothetical protein